MKYHDGIKYFFLKIIFRLRKKLKQILREETLSLYIFAENKYGVYCIPYNLRHNHIPRVIISGSVFEPGTIEYIIKNAGNKDIIHAGAFFGDFLPALDKHCTKNNSHLWSFEPSKQNYEAATRTLQINQCKNCTLIHAGLGEDEKVLGLVTENKSGSILGGGSRFTLNDDLNEKVKIVTLDNFIPTNRTVGIIHLDIEGYEINALRGAIKLIAKQKPILILESIADETWFKKKIMTLGYKKIKDIEHNTIFKT